MTAILGLAAFYCDSAAALVIDGEIVAAAQEERFSRKQRDAGFPHQAVDYCLQEAGLAAADLDFVGFYDKPVRAFGRLRAAYGSHPALGVKSFLHALPLSLRQRLLHPRAIRRGLSRRLRRHLVSGDHQVARAASAFYPSPFEEAAILILDGIGEWATACYGVGRGSELEITRDPDYPHTLGMLHAACASFCGFSARPGEYGFMGLADYGEPRYAELIREQLLDLRADGSLRLDLSYFTSCHAQRRTGRKFASLFGRPPRAPEAPITPSDVDLAASVQQVTEEVVLRRVRHVRAITGMRHLCLAGAGALSSVTNSKVVAEGLFDEVWIQPAASESGAALGSALHIWHQVLGHSRAPAASDRQQGSRLGPQFTTATIEYFLRLERARFLRFDDEGELCAAVAAHLAEGRVVGWFHGRMEFGPRALGGRSVLADPRSPTMQRQLNLQLKGRESFRPFAASVLRERVGDWFDLGGARESPYLALVASVAPSKRLPGHADGPPAVGASHPDALPSIVPAVTHVDGSARVQTVDPVRSPRFHRLLSAFEAATGCPVLINTSFNVRGEPIVCTPADAWHCFLGTDMDVLVLEDLVLEKEDQPRRLIRLPDAHVARFELD
ncbi:MAG: hypothetical protein O2894_12495 [Planctomycetota bacterium]|nr:hypothetical protein [Planctomycetota bacterium]